MLFAGIDLAARIERAECRLLVDGADAVRARRDADDVYVQPMAGGVTVCTETGSPFNKIAGLGFDGAPDPRSLDEAEAAFARIGAPVQAEVSTLGDPSVVELLARRGYVLVGHENVLGLDLRSASPAGIGDGIEVGVCPTGETATWMDVVMEGFAAADTRGVPSHESFPHEVVRRVMADMIAAEGFVQYLAWHEGERAGGATLRMHERVAQLCGAATLPAHRRQGVHAALVETRLDDARRAGCDVAVVTTQPGSTSQANAQRRGFALLYARAMLVRG